MSYRTHELADMAGVSVRTIHFYDEVGLLKPQSYGKNGYRQYGEKELLRLQQILFFRELDFNLDRIREILDTPGFDILQALEMHRNLLGDRIKRMHTLIATIDKTVLKLKGELQMEDNEYYGGFNKEQQEKYEQEIREKYGSTALDESKRRMKGWSRADWERVQQEGGKIFTAIRDKIGKGYDSPEVQAEIKELHAWLNHFYTCNLEMLEGIGHMYNEHPDFAKMWKTQYHEDMPEFLLKAIEHYCYTAKE